MSPSIARYLKDFGEPTPIVPAFDVDAPGLETEILAFPEPEEPQVDLEAERADAFEKGQSEARAEMQAGWDADRAELIAAHRAEIEALRAAHEKALSETLNSKMQQIAGVLADATSERAAEILAPLIEDALVGSAVADLAELVRCAVLEGEIGTLTVTGPLSLFEAFSAALSMPSVALRHVEADDLDLCVAIDDHALVTRMSVWSARLKELMA